jgi:hypothetical protein
MAQLAAGAAVAGTLLSATGSVLGGKATNKASKVEAAALRRQAGQTRASSQREAIEQRRDADLAQSRALALAAAGGGGASDPTVVDIISDLEGEGEYRALTALFNGEEQARGLEDEALAARKAGKNAKTAGIIGGISTVLTGASSLAGKYR